MTLTNRQILEATPAIKRLQEKELPGKMVYAITKNTRVLKNALEDFNNTRSDIVQRHAVTEENGEPKRDEAGGVVFESEEAEREANEELNDVITEEVEVDVHQIGVEALPDDLTPRLMMGIDFMLK